jgi:sulfopyruvate decarboxylase subunit beta
MLTLDQALTAVKRVRRDDDVVITTMAAARQWMTLWDGGKAHPLDMIFVPSCMGHATSFGLGIALAQPRRRVIVCNGDGSMLMNLGSLVTIAAANARNLVTIVLDNGVYEVTGSQPVPRRADFATIARASGFQSVHRFTTPEEWSADAERVLAGKGPTLVWLDIEPTPGGSAPTSPGNAADRARALMAALQQ